VIEPPTTLKTAHRPDCSENNYCMATFSNSKQYDFMYLRFTTQFIDEDNRTQTGFFKAMNFVIRHKLTKDEDEANLKEQYAWLKSNLDAPPWFTDPKGYSHESNALSWFKDSAKEHIEKIQKAIAVLERYNVTAERIWKTTRSSSFRG
jgi:hypothetical protein